MIADAQQRIERAVQLLRGIYSAVEELETLFPGRRFTPDGHMVGSFGEAWAAFLYDLELLQNSAETHDARAPDGRMVQIKATQGDRVAISSEPSHLVVLAIDPTGSATEIFNGPGSVAWEAAGNVQKNGQRPLSLARLRRLMTDVAPESRLPRRERPPF